MPSAWQRSHLGDQEDRGSSARKSGTGLARFTRYEPWDEHAPHAAPGQRLAEGAALLLAPAAGSAHCIWLRVKIWMASAPMATPLPGALKSAAGDGDVGAEVHAS